LPVTSNSGASSRAFELLTIAAWASFELTMTGAAVTIMLPLPWALSAPLALLSRTRMPAFTADQVPRATARACTGSVPLPKAWLKKRAWLKVMMTSTEPASPVQGPDVGGMLTVTVAPVPSVKPLADAVARALEAAVPFGSRPSPVA